MAWSKRERGNAMAQRLSKEAFGKARAFVEREGRPLDRALLAYHLGEGLPEAVIAALSAYQNADGGFGHGLEPDTTAPASTAIATSVGLRLLSAVGAEGVHPMVRAALNWLEQAFDWESGVWPIIGPEVEAAPHAPWWGWSEDLADQWNGFRFNPSAELLGYLYRWRDAAAERLLAAAEARMRITVAETALIEGAYDLKCAIRLAETPELPEDLRARLSDLVVRSALTHSDTDEHGSALEFATRPSALLARPLAPRIDAAAEALIDAQEDDGGWPLFWDWSFVDAAVWEKAKRDWRGFLTREALETLHAHGRIEGL
jgi:hypothetical protein